MAKTVNLTVKVDDTQFKQFIQNFNAFAAQMKNINSQFTQIQNTIQRTTQRSQILVATMNTMLNVAKSISSVVGRVTRHFFSWHALIGAIGGLLGMGGGLFGIDRLASSIMQKRRQVLGLGGDYGRTQATQVFGKSLMEDPGNVLKNIRYGLGGSSEQLGALVSMGIPFGTKMKPEEVLPKILQFLQEKVKGAKEGTELAVTGAYHPEALGITPDVLVRLRTMSTQELKDLEEQIKAHAKEFSLSEKAQKAWSDLEIQFKAAKAALETAFGEKLADLSKPLGELSDNLVKLVKTLLDMPIVEKMIKQLTTWIEQLNTYLQSNNLEADLKKFSDKVESWLPVLTDLKDALVGFANVVRSIYRFLFPIGMTPRGSANPSLPSPPFGGTWPTNPNPLATPNRSVPDSRIFNVPGAIPGIPPSAPGTQGSVTGGSQFASNTGGNASFFGGGSAVGSRSSSARFAGGGNMGGNFGQFTGGSSNTSINGGMGTNRTAAWSSATQKSVPGPESRSTFAGLFGFGGGGGGGGGSRGALDSNNWQGSRTASLVVRNTPGSNAFMSATGMA